MAKGGYHEITSLHKDDIYEVFRDEDTGDVPKAIARRIKALSKQDMDFIANKLGEAFCGCCYWDSLRTIFEGFFGA